MTCPPIPHAVTTAGRRYGPPKPCVGCHGMIDTDDEYLVLLDGPPSGRPALLAAAHCGRWNDRLGDFNHDCADTLHRQWRQAVVTAGGSLLCLRVDDGGPRFFAGDLALHAGTALDVLVGDGTWLCGRFEYQTGAQPWQPLLYLPIGGWDRPVVALQLSEGVIVRSRQGV